MATEERREEREEKGARHRGTPTLVIIQGTLPYVPMYWVTLQDSGPIVCRFLTPHDPAARQQLLTLFHACRPVPCLLRYPLRQQWWHFEAYLVAYKAGPECEVTFVPTGEIRTSEASDDAPVRLRKRRRDAGHPRKRKTAPLGV